MRTVKTMQEIENQFFRLSERNWRRRNVWESGEASRRAKCSRDRLLCEASWRASAQHLTAKAKEINNNLQVGLLEPDPYSIEFLLEYNSPSVGMTLKIFPGKFDVEDFLNNRAKVENLLASLA